MSQIKRRDWLKQASILSAGLGFPTLSFATLNRSEKVSSPYSKEVVRLLFNENPYGPSGAVLNSIDEVKNRSHRYANFYKYGYLELKQLIASKEGVKPENIALGHGSIQPLIWIAILFGGEGKKFVVPDPAFDVVGTYGKKIGTTVKPVLVNSEMKINLQAMEQAIDNDTDLVVIVNPNNPTGTSLSTTELEVFCKKVQQKCPICIDEAYIQYLGEDWQNQSMARLINDNSNMIITRTFSKIYGMAGQRMGFVMGNKDLIEQIENFFMMGFPGNMPNIIGVASAMAALEDESFLKSSRQKNHSMKQNIYSELTALGLEYVNSDANFFYFNTGNFARFKNKMNENNILITGGWPSKKNWGRVTVGTAQDMDTFFKVLKS